MRDIQTRQGYILYLDQLGTSASTASDLASIGWLPHWLDATRSLISRKKPDMYFYWISDSWVLVCEDGEAIFNLVEDVLPELFEKRLFLRGAVVSGTLFDLTNWPDLDKYEKDKTVVFVPICGAGLTRAAQIEANSVKGMRVVCDYACTHRPTEGVRVADEEQERCRVRLAGLYDGRSYQQYHPYMIDIAWWRKDAKRYLELAQQYARDSSDEREKEHLQATIAAMEKWCREWGR